jgi:hypothetical protein
MTYYNYSYVVKLYLTIFYKIIYYFSTISASLNGLPLKNIDKTLLWYKIKKIYIKHINYSIF